MILINSTHNIIVSGIFIQIFQGVTEQLPWAACEKQQWKIKNNARM